MNAKSKGAGFTLIELLMVIGIIIILAGIAIPNFAKAKERTLIKEAIANLKLIAAAEKIYRMESNPTAYYLSSGTVTDIGAINTNLKLSLNETNWDYSITGGTNTFTTYAQRQLGSYSSCKYSIDQSQEEPVVSSGTCP